MDSIAQLTSELADRYAIESEIGAGGMARVYLARDLRHGRGVAIKVLNPELAAMLGVDRFLSEIKVTANLHHPNLLPLFDSGEAAGQLFYVVPFVEGGSLRARLAREKHLPVDEAVRITLGIASALQYAHKQGIIHRDLKPENILMHEGQPLVADFGIALAVKKAGGERFTQTGMSLGTPQYSSPEQAMGEAIIDGRSDIYSLGVLLYEMLAGDPPHQASTLQAIVAKVLTERPRDIRTIRATCPEHVARAIDCALAKLAADRFSSAQEFADALKGHADPTSPYHPSAASFNSVNNSRRPSRARSFATLAVVGVVAVLTTVSAMQLRAPAHEPHERAVRFSLTVDEDETVASGAVGTPLALSPDGGILAYLSSRFDGIQELYVRPMNQSHARAIPGTTKALHPTFSPDGRAIAFMSGGMLQRVELSGTTAPSTLATTSDTVYGIAWGARDFILGRVRGGLAAVPAIGGAIRQLTTVDTAAGERSHRWPVMLPGGKSALFTIWRGRKASATLAIASLDDGRITPLGLAGTSGLGIVDEHLVFADSTGRIMAVPFDSRRRKITGVPVLGEQGSVSLPGAAKAALSHSGTLAYSTSLASSLEMVFVDTLGRVKTLLDRQRERFNDPRFSPDGRKIAVAIGSDTTSDIFIIDVATNGRERLTAQAGNKSRPEWTADGKRVLYRKVGSAGAELWERMADKSLQAERVVSADNDAAQGLPTHDGRSVIYRTDSESRFGMNIWWLDTTANATPQKIAQGRAPAISPDNRWIAYSSSQSGTLEIYIRSTPSPNDKVMQCQISDDGGSEPGWSRDGRHLYYRSGWRFMSATLTASASGCPSVSRGRVFEVPTYASEYHRQYDIAPNGTGFVMLREYGHESGVEIVHNWVMDLRARMTLASPDFSPRSLDRRRAGDFDAAAWLIGMKMMRWAVK